MEEIYSKLHSIYYDPANGYPDSTRLYKLAQADKLKVTQKQVTSWYKTQEVNQIYHPPPKVKSYNHIQSHNRAPGELQVDLMDVSRFSHQNKGYKFLLNVIDIYSRYVWSIPIKNKTPVQIAPHIQSIIDEIVTVPKGNHQNISFSFDQGREFMGDVSSLLKSQNIPIFLNDPSALNQHHRMGILERLNRTIWEKLRKYMTSNNTLTYHEALPQLIQSYNNTPHSAIIRRPVDVFKKGKDPVIVVTPEMMERILSVKPFNIGDTVRFQKIRKTFEKRSFLSSYSDTIHKVVEIKGNRFIFDNGKGYYAEQLVKTMPQAASQSTESIAPKDDFNTKYKEAQEHKRFERKQQEEFSESSKLVQQQIVQSKRERKPVKKYGFEN